MTNLLFYVRPDGSYAGQFDEPQDGCTVVDVPPTHASQIWNGAEWAEPEPSIDAQPTLEDRRAAKIMAIVAMADTLLGVGAPVTGGLHVALDNNSRSDLTSMATAATNALSGALPWPESYARGWITIENSRIPLAIPMDGLVLAATVGEFYGTLVQHRRDLKNAALAAEDAAALDAIDITAGWPA